MHDPKPPEIRRGERGVCPHEQPDGVKCGNGKRGKEKQPRHVARVFGPQFVPQSTKQDHDPEEQTHRQQNLPKSPEMKKKKKKKEKKKNKHTHKTQTKKQTINTKNQHNHKKPTNKNYQNQLINKQKTNILSPPILPN